MARGVLVRLTSPGGVLVICCMCRAADAPLKWVTHQVQGPEDTVAEE
jgi:hypothetical protein